MQTSEDKTVAPSKTDLLNFLLAYGLYKSDRLRTIIQQIDERNDIAYERIALKELHLVTMFILSLCSTMSRDTVAGITTLALPDYPAIAGWLDDVRLRFFVTGLQLAQQQEVVTRYIDEEKLMALYKNTRGTKDVLLLWSEHYVIAYLALVRIQNALKVVAPEYKLREISDFSAYNGHESGPRTDIAVKIYDMRNATPIDMMYMAKKHNPQFSRSVSQVTQLIGSPDTKSTLEKKIEELTATSNKKDMLSILDRQKGHMHELISVLAPIASAYDSKNETKKTVKTKTSLAPTETQESKTESKDDGKAKGRNISKSSDGKKQKEDETVMYVGEAGHNNLLFTHRVIKNNLINIDDEITVHSIKLKALYDDKDVTPEQKIRLEILVQKIKENVIAIQSKIQKDFDLLDCADRNLVSENTKTLEVIREQIRQVSAKLDIYVDEIENESQKLDHAKPKEKKLTAAEKKFKLAQEKKALEKKKQEEKAQEKSEKIQTTPKKTPTKPASALSAPKTPNTPKKPQEVKKSPAAVDLFAEARISHLNEACKNLIYINKMLTLFNDDEKLPADVLHYALLYNIFRCFQSLKMYQQYGGTKRTINPDEVANLRHMIIHHGANNANTDAVKNFACQLQIDLPPVILTLKNRDLAHFKLTENLRQILISEFQLVESARPCAHSRLAVSATPLYARLAKFHEDKADNDDDKSIAESVFENYIPAMRNLLKQLNKVSITEWHLKPDYYIEMFFFQLQALRMLATMCGEFREHFKTICRNIHLESFLDFCRFEVRNIMGHEEIDFVNPTQFYFRLNEVMSKINEKDLLASCKQKEKEKEKEESNSYSGLQQAGLFASTEVKSDNTVQTPAKSLNFSIQ
jgi:hypothetical protein